MPSPSRPPAGGLWVGRTVATHSLRFLETICKRVHRVAAAGHDEPHPSRGVACPFGAWPSTDGSLGAAHLLAESGRVRDDDRIGERQSSLVVSEGRGTLAVHVGIDDADAGFAEALEDELEPFGRSPTLRGWRLAKGGFAVLLEVF